MGRRVIPAEVRGAVIAAVAAGGVPYRVARAYGVSRAAVHAWCAAEGLSGERLRTHRESAYSAQVHAIAHTMLDVIEQQLRLMGDLDYLRRQRLADIMASYRELLAQVTRIITALREHDDATTDDDAGHLPPG